MIFADQQIPDDATVTPGIEGFLTFAVLAVIVILLVISMSKHLRRIDKRAAEEAAEAEDAERRHAESVSEEMPDGETRAGGTPADVSPESGEDGPSDR